MQTGSGPTNTSGSAILPVAARFAYYFPVYACIVVLLVVLTGITEALRALKVYLSDFYPPHTIYVYLVSFLAAVQRSEYWLF